MLVPVDGRGPALAAEVGGAVAQQAETRIGVAHDPTREVRFADEEVTGGAGDVGVAAALGVGGDRGVAGAALEDRRVGGGPLEGLVGAVDVAVAAAVNQRVP